MKGGRWVDAISVVVTIILVTTTELGQARNICPNNLSPCTCTVKTKGLVLTCESTNLEAIKKSMTNLKEHHGTVVQYLTIRYTDTPHLTNFIFMGLDIRHLIISNTNLAVLEASSISGLAAKLEILDLSLNRIASVPTKALKHLSSTRYVNLNHNNITKIQENAFQGMVELERLSIYQNQISNIDANAFVGVNQSLVYLNLGSNNLTSIPIKALSKLPNLTTLELQENRIETIRESDFTGLSNLDTLKLGHNMITQLGPHVFRGLPRMSSLELEFNKIRGVDNKAFAGLEEKLEWLKLGSNSISEIPSDALKGMHRLREFDLKGNNLTEIKEDDFMGFGNTIKFLYLQNNGIDSLPMSVFSNMHSLETIDLSNNKIEHFPQDVFQPIIETVIVLDFHGNPLKCGCDLIWYKQWLVKSTKVNQEKVKPIALKSTCQSGNHHYEITKAPLEKMYCPENVNSNSRISASVALLLIGPLLGFVNILSTAFLLSPTILG